MEGVREGEREFGECTIRYDTTRHDGIGKAMIGSEGYQESIFII